VLQEVQVVMGEQVWQLLTEQATMVEPEMP
jgi:hypothetical protein